MELLVTANWRMWRWIRAFRERAGRGRIFGLHNYPDVTRLRTKGTRLFVRACRTPRSGSPRPAASCATAGSTTTRAARRAVRHVFKLAALIPRVRRVYIYNWRYDGNERWDSDLISSTGSNAAPTSSW